MRNKNKFNKILLYLGALLLIIFLDLLGVWSSAQGLFIRGGDTVSRPTSFIRDSLNNAFNIIEGVSDLNNENIELREENKELLSELAELKYLEEENEELRKALSIPDLEESSYVNVKVITNLASGTQGLFFLNKGSNSGIEEGQIVIDADSYYIGKITTVTKFHSEGIFASQAYNDLPADIVGKDIRGVIRPDSDGWELDMIPKDSALQEGDIVILGGDKALVETGNSSIKVILGLVVKIIDDEENIFTKAKVSNVIEYSATKTAFVLTNKD